jgi:hypothetical protein
LPVTLEMSSAQIRRTLGFDTASSSAADHHLQETDVRCAASERLLWAGNAPALNAGECPLCLIDAQKQTVF